MIAIGTMYDIFVLKRVKKDKAKKTVNGKCHNPKLKKIISILTRKI